MAASLGASRWQLASASTSALAGAEADAPQIDVQSGVPTGKATDGSEMDSRDIAGCIKAIGYYNYGGGQRNGSASAGRKGGLSGGDADADADAGEARYLWCVDLLRRAHTRGHLMAEPDAEFDYARKYGLSGTEFPKTIPVGPHLFHTSGAWRLDVRGGHDKSHVSGVGRHGKGKGQTSSSTSSHNYYPHMNVLCRTPRGMFLVGAKDLVVGPFVRMLGSFTEQENHVFRHEIRPGEVVVEVGANIGSFTVALGEIVGERGVVYAFEPFRRVFQVG